MTEDDLVDDLCRLLREGLVMVDADQRNTFEEDTPAVPRFSVTARGRDVCATEDAVCRVETAAGDAVIVRVRT